MAEVLHLLKKHLLLLLLPTVAVFIAVAWVVTGLPNIYKSTTYLTLSPPKISDKVAPSLTDEDISHRLQSISSSVLSRSTLQEIIKEFGLYAKQRNAGTPDELIVADMRSNIKVEPDRTDRNEVVGFRVSYRYIDPETTQAVTANIADRFISAQTKESKQSAETTREFIDDRLANAKSTLDAIEKQRLGIMLQNVDTLPESSQGLIAQLTGLRGRETTISKDKESLMVERGRLEESIRALNTQMRLIDRYGEQETEAATKQAARIEDTPAYAELVKKRAEFRSKLAALKQKFRPKHPDVIQAQIDIDKINDEIKQLANSTDKRVALANENVARKAEMQKNSIAIERDKAQSQINSIDQQLQAKDAELAQNSVQIAALERKINTIPNVKVALEGVTNEYDTAKANYEELQKKFNSAQQQVERESNDQGETIKVIDPANRPETAENASKIPIFLGIGAGAGFALGLLLIAFIEVPKLFKLQTIEDTEYYTGVPVLAAVPPLLSDEELAGNRRLAWLKLGAGVAASIAAIPVLIVVLHVTRFFEMLS